MQAAVSPLRWGPPGDSSTASDWGCATAPDSSTNNTQKRMLMDQIRWELRMRGGEHGAEREGAGRHSWSAVIHEGPCVCVSVYLLCACEREALAAQDYAPSYWHVFTPKCLEVWEMKGGCDRREEGLEKQWIDGWMWEAIYSTLLCSFLLPSNMPFPIFYLLRVTPSLSLTICLPRSHTSLRMKRQHIKT